MHMKMQRIYSSRNNFEKEYGWKTFYLASRLTKVKNKANQNIAISA